MKHDFKTREEAKNFRDSFIQGLTEDQLDITIRTLDDNIIHQEHNSYLNTDENIRYDISLLEFADRFQVTIRSTKYSRLVDAAENGDLELFEKEMMSGPNPRALGLAFVTAIRKQHLSILEFMYNNGYVPKLDLYKDPLITASREDKIDSFRFILQKNPKLPTEILGPIFHDNSHKVMNFILQDPLLSEEIKQDEYLTTWAKNALEKHDNEAIRLFRAHVRQQ